MGPFLCVLEAIRMLHSHSLTNFAHLVQRAPPLSALVGAAVRYSNVHGKVDLSSEASR